MENFLNRLARNPYAPIDGASVTRVDELGNGYDDWNNLIAPKYEEPQQTWGETALGVATAPARIATSLVESLSPYGADGWQVPPLVQEGANALTAVGDAYNYGMDQDEINNRALGMAGFMMGGGGIAAGRAPMIAANASKEGAIPALMNYDVPDVFYHGTPDASFSKFNIDEIRARAPEQNNGFAGVSMSPYPDEASGYASLRGAAPGMFPLRSDATNPFVWNVDDFYDGKMPKYQFGKLKGDEPATLQRLRGVIPDYKFRGGDFPSYGFAMSEALAAAGYDALDIVHGGKLSERAALAPNTVRSATTGETLFSNADSKPALLASGLDMGQEARLARAEKRYDTTMPWYHGTRAGGFDEFDPSLANSSSKTGVPDGTTVFSSSPENASTYAAFREDMFGNPQYGDGAAVMPVYLDKSTLDMVVDAKGAGWRDIEYNGQFYDANELAQMAKDLEYEGLLVRNVIDSKISHGAKPSDTYFKFSPQGIRSVNAAFDPAKSDSANLLAANADSRPALLGAGQEQDIPDWLLPYLGR